LIAGLVAAASSPNIFSSSIAAASHNSNLQAQFGSPPWHRIRPFETLLFKVLATIDQICHTFFGFIVAKQYNVPQESAKTPFISDFEIFSKMAR
jgi:hypothetical protein